MYSKTCLRRLIQMPPKCYLSKLVVSQWRYIKHWQIEETSTTNLSREVSLPKQGSPKAGFTVLPSLLLSLVKSQVTLKKSLLGWIGHLGHSMVFHQFGVTYKYITFAANLMQYHLWTLKMIEKSYKFVTYYIQAQHMHKCIMTCKWHLWHLNDMLHRDIWKDMQLKSSHDDWT